MVASDFDDQYLYFWLKSGRQVGVDSVYLSDYNPDCESEDKIRFYSHTSNRMGLLNAQGRVVIPATYNYVTPFHNGLAVGLLGARAVCLSGEKDTMQCEHPSWVGGHTVLLNAQNHILADHLPDRLWPELNWYSLQINAPVVDTTITSTFRAVNGDRYSFINYRKEFTRWFYDVFVPAICTGEAARVAPLCYDELAVAGQPFRGWPHFERDAFVKKFYQPVLYPKLKGRRPGEEAVAIFRGDLNRAIFHGVRFQDFYTDCNQPFDEKYPTFTVVINSLDAAGKRDYEHQEQFTFIRTAEGYRLFNVAL